MGKYQTIREIIRGVMCDGMVHTAEELHRVCEKNGIQINRNRMEIYNAVHQLKKRGEIVSDGENGYILVTRMGKSEKVETETEQEETGSFTSGMDLSDFEVVKPAARKEAKQVISILGNGDLALNGVLSKVIRTNQVEIHIKKDCTQILLVPGGAVLLDISKNNRIKNYAIYEKLKKKKIKLPVYYVGEWDEEKKVWLGDLVMTNPNKTVGKAIK